MKRKSEYFLSIIGVILAINIYVFATDKIQFSYLIFFVILLSSLLLFVIIKDKKFGNEIFIPILFSIYALISMLFSYDFTRAYRYSLFLLVFLFIYVILSKVNSWHETFLRTLFFGSIVIVSGTYFSFLFPNIYKNLIFPLFNLENQIVMEGLIRMGAHTGLTNQTAPNAFLISIGIALLYSRIYSKIDLKVLTKVALIIYLLALSMTLKRSFILANLASFIVLTYVKYRTENNKISNIFKVITSITAVISIILIISPFVPTIQDTINRFGLAETGIDTSGRDQIYTLGIKMFLIKPFFGHGIDSVPTFYSNNFGVYELQQMHNIYIQMLAELGLFFAVILLFLFMFNYYLAYKTTKYALKNKDKKMIYILSSSLYMQTFWLIYGFFGNPITEHTYLLIYLLFSSITLFYFKKQKALDRLYLVGQ
ncbi:O-antigen ligase family protein [Jeotgalibaca sp. MA1X17-3]|uniref:O-antigen ligase family protein n=1 Tax=Jeotgalibaca sp. MA1X17-3 TaxID=2908211 RepID=UPI001F460058|nr:O-antigen ligase family protein [Jeotgalibaca sp. MA1X17-3]UJF15258.1 O-antigen ligase family protein [Jeotgalibaca sp. MA1X17-3]